MNQTQGTDMKIKKAQTKFRKLFSNLVLEHGERKASAIMAFWTADYLDDLEMLDMVKSHIEPIEEEFKTLKGLNRG